MSDMAEKLQQPEQGDAVARRTFESLANVRGFRVEPMSMSERATVSIAPMGTRSFWRHDGNGKWNARGAMYEKVET